MPGLYDWHRMRLRRSTHTGWTAGSAVRMKKVAAAGVVLVDATRRGRLLPDSFAKTIPIW